MAHPLIVFFGGGSCANSFIGNPRRYFSMHQRIYLFETKNKSQVNSCPASQPHKGKKYKGAHLRSRMPTPAFFIAWPSIFHSSSQLPALSFVSAARPMDFKNASGVLISGATTELGPRPHRCVSGVRGLGTTGRTLVDKERVSEGNVGSERDSRCRFISAVAMFDLETRTRKASNSTMYFEFQETNSGNREAKAVTRSHAL